MKPIVSQAHPKRGRASPGLREQGGIWALAVLGFVVGAIGSANEGAMEPSRGVDCAWPRSVRLERGFTRAVTCTPPAGGGRPLQGPARWLFGQRVALGAADARLLEALPHIGPARARAILEERRVQPYASVDDLERVHGIGPATVERLRPFLAIRPPSRAAPSALPGPAPGAASSPAPLLTPRSAKTDGEG